MSRIERTLVERLRRGEDEAYAQVIDRLYVRAYRFLTHLCRDSGAAEDLTQETFLAVWRRIGSFEGRSSLETWVFGIAYREFLRWRDKRAVDTVPLDESDLSDGSDLSTAVLDADERACVRRAVYSLPHQYREIVCMVHMDGLTYREAAGVLGIPLGTVKSRMNAAFRLLRERLSESEVQGDEVREPESLPGW